MGCASSSAAPGDHDAEKKKRERETTADTDAMAIGTASSHISSIISDFKPFTSSTSISVGSLSLRYACLSQRGRDPDHPSKLNQDCFGHHFNPSSAFFAVYDGHGPYGEQCSHFVRKKLPTLLKNNIKQQADDLLPVVDVIHSSLHDAHVDCNEELRKSEINDSHSGTTSVGVYINNDNRITISNVGDSRILLGTASGLHIQAVPLSKDHTPYRQDEAKRCTDQGARILSFGQVDPKSVGENEDDVEDPPRVWARDGHYPGTAFTRSIGDSVAERLGVYAEPEMLTMPISPSERLLVLASDGVFDVVTNQEVVDICFRHRHDPAQACKEIIDKSHKEWLLNDDCCEDEANYDDMTCIVIIFDHPGQDNSQPPQETSPQQQTHRHGKRVRQKTLRNLEEMEMEEQKEGR